jgi:hypothetical protein
MRIRPATLSDVPVLAKIATKAFANDPTYAHYFPGRSQYPHDFYRFFEEEIRITLMSFGKLIMVAETDETDQWFGPSGDLRANTGSRVVAYAIFVRYGTAAERALWSDNCLSKSMHIPAPHIHSQRNPKFETEYISSLL